MVKAYCVKCKKKVKVKDPKPTKLKNKRKAIKGSCPTCKTKLYQFTK
jgi:hypothetical protein